LIGLLAAAVLSTVAMAATFDAYFADASGNKLGLVQEGDKVYVAVKLPCEGTCGISEFPADITIFDFKTGAYIWVEDDPNTQAYEGAWFRESSIGSGLYFWVTGPGSTSKVVIEVGSRANYNVVPYGQTHVLGSVAPAPQVPITLAGRQAGQWEEGAWEYVDEDVLGNNAGIANTGYAAHPQNRLTARTDFEGLDSGPGQVLPVNVAGRLENMDTLILIVSDNLDERNIDQDQIKIIDAPNVLTVTPTSIWYECAGMCENVVVRIEDADENLNPNEVEYVPFFVIVNPGSWNPANSQINNFCSLLAYGGYDPAAGADLQQPIRWYNIYDEPVVVNGVPSRYIQYPADWLAPGNVVGRVLFFAAETGPDTGVFEYNFGNVQDFQQALGFRRFDDGTTVAFYYIDPNDFDDMSVVTADVCDMPHSETYIVDVNGTPVDEVRLGGGLYVRVYDADANIDACCQDHVVVHVCDPHNEDDSEYWVLDEVSNDSGVFATQAGMALLPVWDAVGGYQLVFDDWKLEAFNEDTIYVRYNSVDYQLTDLNNLGDGNANDGAFPPAINDLSPRTLRNRWDVSFDSVKVYDTQVFDGTTHHMRLLDGSYQPVDEIPIGGSLYLEVVDPDQNESPLIAERIVSRWNIDASAVDDQGRNHNPRYDGAFGLPDPATLTPDAGEDSAPIWWLSRQREGQAQPPPEQPPEPPGGGEEPPHPPEGDSDIMTPAGAVQDTPATPYVDPYLGGPQWNVPGRNSDDISISMVLETVKVFIWDAQTGNWEAVDLKEYGGPNSGVFRSTTCVLVSSSVDHGVSGLGNLGASAGDTIMAFYQDPSNHSDVSIVSIKVSSGGAENVVPPVAPSVAFDAASYIPGDTVTITVTDPAYAAAGSIQGDDILVLKDASGAVLQSWDELASSGAGVFSVTYELPADVAIGTLTAIYTDPMFASRVAQATAQVLAAELSEVTGISVTPNPFDYSTTFSIVAEPAGAVADSISISIYDLTGRMVAELAGEDTDSVTWDGGSLRNGAYVYVAVVEGAGKTWTFRGFVYIKR